MRLSSGQAAESLRDVGGDGSIEEAEVEVSTSFTSSCNAGELRGAQHAEPATPTVRRWLYEQPLAALQDEEAKMNPLHGRARQHNWKR